MYGGLNAGRHSAFRRNLLRGGNDMNKTNRSYTDNIHFSGRIWFILVYFCIYLFPLVTSIYFGAWPTWKQFFSAAIGVIPVYWTVGIVEAFTYMPILGAGGSYLGFITGNMSNIKVPVAINAMESMGVRQGTEEGDVISTIVIAVSSIVTCLIIIVFVVLMVPLTPVFSRPELKPAFDNVVPALFGGLMVVFVSKNWKIGVPPVVLCAVLFLAFPALGGVYPLIIPVVAALTVLMARKMYIRGILPGKKL